MGEGTRYFEYSPPTVPMRGDTQIIARQYINGVGFDTSPTISELSYQLVDIMAFGAVGDGITDDTPAFLLAAASGGGVWIPPGYKFVINAGNIPCANVAFVGAGIRDVKPSGASGFQYGNIGSQIWITGSVNPPFRIGPAVGFYGINFFWPNQTGVSSTPVVYPPLFTQQMPFVKVQRFDFVGNQITNSYISFEFDVIDTAFGAGAINIFRNHIYSIYRDFITSKTPDVLNITNNEFSIGTFADSYQKNNANLANWSAANAWHWEMVGDGAPDRLSSVRTAGIVHIGNYLKGHLGAFTASTGAFLNSEIIGCGIETSRVLQIDPSATISAVQFIGGKWFIYDQNRAGTNNDCIAVVINNPVAITSQDPDIQSADSAYVAFTGVDMPFIEGSLADIVGANILRVSFDQIISSNIAHSRSTSGTYYGLRVCAPGASVHCSGLLQGVATADGPTVIGIQINAAGQSRISDGLKNFTVPVDIETGAGELAVTGCTVTGTVGNNKTVVTGGNVFFPSLGCTGTMNATDVLNVTVTSTAVSGGSASGTFTAPAGGPYGAVQIAIWVAQVINGLTAVAGAGYCAGNETNTVLLYSSLLQSATGSMSASLTGTGSVAFTPGTADGKATPQNLVISGNSMDKPVVPYETITPTEGGSYSMANLWGDRTLTRLTPAGALNAITVAFPPNPADGEIRTLASTQTINSVALTGTLLAGSSAVPISADQSHSWQYIGSASGWQPLN